MAGGDIMKIGIIYYTESGHTLQVCEALKQQLTLDGHETELKPVTVYDIKSNKTLKDRPSTEGYDFIIFGTPVQGYSLPRPMAEYLNSITLSENQNIGCIITQYFKLSWMGGNHTKRQLLTALEKYHPHLYAYSIIHWSSKRRNEQISKTVSKFSNIEW